MLYWTRVQISNYPQKLKNLTNGTIFAVICTGWPKSNVSKVRAYSSASDHLIRKIFSGVCRGSHWFEEYLKIIEISDNFFE